MKKLYFIIIPVLICAIICSSCLCLRLASAPVSDVYNEPVGSSPTIIIDAGHGGFDGGATTAEGYPEKDINLAIAVYLRDLLEISGYRVIMTRESDASLEDDGLDTIRARKSSDIHNRMVIMEENVDSIFVSIHQNHYSQERYWGMQVFYSPNYSDSSQLIAESIQETVTELLQPDNTRSIKECGTSVYLMYNAVRPAVLVECGFLSNEHEASLLMTDQYRKQISYCIYLGLLKYFGR